MRLNRLHLTRYGGFADAVLDLPRPEGADVTIVLGPNEAGKSTAFAAWLDLLYGIPARNPPAAWRFERAQLQIAADVEAGGTSRHLRRLPAKKDNLRDGEGSPVSEDEMTALLHGLDRDGYRTRFSLDRAMLDAGGRDIAAGRGDLGALLFAGLSGLSGVQDALGRAEADAAAFHRLGGRRTKTTALGAGLNTLKEADAALKRRLTPEARARFDADVEAAEKAEADATDARDAARRAAALERDAADLREIDAEIAGLDLALADLPACTWTPAQAEMARAALKAAQGAATARAEAEAAVKAAVAEANRHAPIPGEGVAAEVLATLGAMRIEDAAVLDRLGPTNDGDLTRIEERRAERAPGLAEQRARLGLSSPATGVAARIEPALRAAAEAQAQAARAARAEKRATETLGAMPALPDAGDAAALRAALDGLRVLNLPRLRAARDEAAHALEAAGVAPPEGALPDPDDLRTRVESWRTANGELKTAEDALAEAAEQRDAARRALETTKAAAAIADAGAVEDARQARDAAWTRHRTALDAQSADVFAEAMQVHDRLVAGLAEAAARAEAARRAEKDLHEAEARHTARMTACGTARAELVRRDLGDLPARLGLPENTAPDALAPRLERLREAARAAPAARRAEAALTEAHKERAKLLDRLRQLLPGADDVEAAAMERLRAAEEAAEARGRHSTAAKAVEDARRAEADANRDAEAAERRLEAERAAAGAGAVRLEDLPALRALETAEREDAVDAKRADDLTRAREAAAPELARLIALSDPGADLIAFARRRAEADARAAQARQGAQKALETAREALAKAAARYAAAEKVLAGALKGQGGEGMPETRVAALSEAARLRDERAEHQRRADAVARRHDPNALAAARTLPPDPARLGVLEAAAGAAEDTLREAIGAAHDAHRAREAAQGGDAAARAAQARATVLADLEEGARTAAATLLGHMAGQAALARIVAENRGPMVAAASEAFAELTCREHDGLDVFGADGTVLTARKGAQCIPVESLSEGTRAQLFLALRVAGHAAFCDRHGPLPFVTDDILEAFDDDRAAAALRMAARMGAGGQVVFLTHHAHIAEMAQRTIPGARVAQMPRQG